MSEEGAVYLDVTKQRLWQYCPKHGWIDVDDGKGFYDFDKWKPHLKCLEETQSSNKRRS